MRKKNIWGEAYCKFVSFFKKVKPQEMSSAYNENKIIRKFPRNNLIQNSSPFGNRSYKIQANLFSILECISVAEVF